MILGIIGICLLSPDPGRCRLDQPLETLEPVSVSRWPDSLQATAGPIFRLSTSRPTLRHDTGPDYVNYRPALERDETVCPTIEND